MLFRQLFDQDTWTYTYLIADSSAQEAVLVDPVVEQVERDLKLIRELGLTLRYCLETHIHADHITGTGKLRELTKCQGIVPENAHANCADRFIKDGEVLQVGNIQIEAIATPGHTDSHMAYLVNQELVLTGDALFIRGSGRTDFQSGNAGMLYDSVTQRLFSLPDQTLVYPGHDYRGHTMSTIAEEKHWNPRFVEQPGETAALKDRQSFIEFMDNLKLPNPKKIMEAVPANEQCGGVAALV
jgi:glyoxylase-like metal-dependent hydrolase (beta-lactamase superfamily II)